MAHSTTVNEIIVACNVSMGCAHSHKIRRTSFCAEIMPIACTVAWQKISPMVGKGLDA